VGAAQPSGARGTCSRRPPRALVRAGRFPSVTTRMSSPSALALPPAESAPEPGAALLLVLLAADALTSGKHLSCGCVASDRLGPTGTSCLRPLVTAGDDWHPSDVAWIEYMLDTCMLVTTFISLWSIKAARPNIACRMPRHGRTAGAGRMQRGAVTRETRHNMSQI
jgi:hypothetical protein